MKPEHPTIDTRMVFRCMLVALDDASTAICRRALRPLDAVTVADVAEACRRMSEVHPLIVVLHDDAATLPELTELAVACGAEMISIARPPDAGLLGRQILEALRKGEARRAGR